MCFHSTKILIIIVDERTFFKKRNFALLEIFGNYWMDLVRSSISMTVLSLKAEAVGQVWKVTQPQTIRSHWICARTIA